MFWIEQLAADSIVRAISAGLAREAHMNARDNRPGRLAAPDEGASIGPNMLAPVAVLSAAMFGALLHPHPLVIGVLSAILVVAGFLAAAVVLARGKWQLSAAGDRLVLPGLLLMFGFLAAALCDADRAAQHLSLLAG